MSLTVIYEDNHLLVVSKPAGLLVQGDRTGDESLVDQAKAYRRLAEHKTAGVYLGLVHRLDRPVSGVVVLARTSKAAARLSAQFRDGRVEKRYLAVAERSRGETTPTTQANDAPDRVEEPSAFRLWEDALRKDSATNRVTVLPIGEADRANVQLARTRCRRLSTADSLVLLELVPETGRGHQLRAQASSRGLPIFGDRKYGSRHSFDGAIALHAQSLSIRHPVRDETCCFSCPAPTGWNRFPFDPTRYLADDQ